MAINLSGLNNPQLREALQRITRRYEKWPYILKHIECISELAMKYTHSIVLERKATEKDYHCNCFSYAFDLLELPEIKDRKLWEKLWAEDKYPSSKFVTHLVEAWLKKIEPSEAGDGDYVMYFQRDKVVHAGKVYADKVVSKWGTGHWWKHGVYEIPREYSSKVRCFRQIRSSRCRSVYKNWVDIQESYQIISKGTKLKTTRIVLKNA